MSRILQLHLRAGAGFLNHLAQTLLIRKYRMVQDLLQHGKAKVQLVIKHTDACHKGSGKLLRLLQVCIRGHREIHTSAV